MLSVGVVAIRLLVVDCVIVAIVVEAFAGLLDERGESAGIELKSLDVLPVGIVVIRLLVVDRVVVLFDLVVISTKDDFPVLTLWLIFIRVDIGGLVADSFFEE